MSGGYRISFEEAELLQSILAMHVSSLEAADRIGALDSVAVAEFVGFGGPEMDNIDEQEFRKVIRERRDACFALQKKLKRIFGI